MPKKKIRNERALRFIKKLRSRERYKLKKLMKKTIAAGDRELQSQDSFAEKIVSSLKDEKGTKSVKSGMPERPYRLAESFSLARKLKLHMVVHSGKKPYLCVSCKESFSQPEFLKRHIQIFHEETEVPKSLVKVYRPPLTFHNGDTEESISSADSKLLVPIKAYSKESSYHCVVCNEKFTQLGIWKEHIIKAHNTKEQSFCCTICHKSFSAAGGLKTHLSIHSGERPYLCDVCGKRFLQKAHLKNHIKTHTEPRLKHCRACNQSFSLLEDLKDHQKNAHREVRQSLYACTVCGKSFLRRGSLQNHMLFHFGGKTLQSVPHCTICNKTYSSAGSLKLHMELHAGTRLYECLLCNKSFRQKGHLKTHNIRIHKAKPSCQSTEFLRESSGLHAKKLPYQCATCDESFSEPGHLKEHLKAHIGLQVFRCATCLESFSEVKLFKEHLKAHTTQQMYHCGNCKNAFEEVGQFKEHLKSHIIEQPFLSEDLYTSNQMALTHSSISDFCVDDSK